MNYGLLVRKGQGGAVGGVLAELGLGYCGCRNVAWNRVNEEIYKSKFSLDTEMRGLVTYIRPIATGGARAVKRPLSGWAIGQGECHGMG